MVNYPAALDATFAALSDPTRRAILARLAASPEASVTELASPFAMSLPAISKHLQVLEGAGLLARRREGRHHHCRLVAAPLESANEWLDRYSRFWDRALNALGRYLEESNEQEKTWPPHPRSPRRRSASRAPSRRPARRSSGPGPTRKR